MDVGCSQIGEWAVITITHVVEIISLLSSEVACYITYTDILDVCWYEILCSFCSYGDRNITFQHCVLKIKTNIIPRYVP